jgi:hypothetical protein
MPDGTVRDDSFSAHRSSVQISNKGRGSVTLYDQDGKVFFAKIYSRAVTIEVTHS